MLWKTIKLSEKLVKNNGAFIIFIFQTCLSQIDMFCVFVTSRKKDERTGNIAGVNIELMVLLTSQIHWFLENLLFTTVSEIYQIEWKINDGRGSFTTVVEV